MPNTPYFSIELDTITAKYQELRSSLPGFQFFYALKANPEVCIIKTLLALGANFEIASVNELHTLLTAKIQPQQIIYSNPVKAPEHIAEAFRLGIQHFAFDSHDELDKLAAYAPGSSVYLRLRVSDHGSTFPLSKKFGANAEDSTLLMTQARALGLRPFGLAFHVGSQCTNPHLWESAIQVAGLAMRELKAAGIKLHMVNIGGGFPAKYNGEQPDLSGIGHAILQAVSAHLPYPVALFAEPGRALVAESGTLVTTVIGQAIRDGRKWLYLDAGAFSGLIETLETNNTFRYPITTTKDAGSAAPELYTVTGPTCDPQDTLFYDIPLARDLTIGDQIFIHSAGAYSIAYASRFNGFDIPQVKCYHSKKIAWPTS